MAEVAMLDRVKRNPTWERRYPRKWNL